MKTETATARRSRSNVRSLTPAQPSSPRPGTTLVPAPVLPTAPCRLLLADDDSGVRSGLAAVLSAEGYFVIPARDGQEAISLAAREPVDLAVLDLNMPVKNGWNTFEQLTREHPLLPIVIITARANQLFTALGAGAGALLEKPLEIPVLLQTIERLLAETLEARLARLAGRKAEFTYAQGRPGPN